MLDGYVALSSTLTLLLPVPATPLERFCLGEAVRDREALGGEDTELDCLRCAWMDQYTAQSSGATLQKDPPDPLEKGAESTVAQILAAIESLQHAMQTQIAAIVVDVNLLRADLRVVVESSVATEKQVTCLQSDMDMLKDSVAILKAKTHKLEARVNSHLRELYASPWSVGVTRIQEYLDGLRMPHLTEAQVEELEGEVLLEDLVEALGGMASRKAPGPEGLPVEFYHFYFAVLLPQLLEILHEA
ncbi:hypothetical protein NDU88_002975 [Pleurodeles waltl]|uniref:Uncharacterized protein n=1 Tax=Pleurodeles waltl TaxID=8319 RepID=A0AAV7UZA0_PLEWA|nr:hypothetical protein NDU88_002975 [Pleurodeles waltl]